MSSVATHDTFAGIVLEGRAAVLAALGELTDAKVGLLGDPHEVTRLVARLADASGALVVFQDEGQWVLPRRGGAVPLLGAALAPLPGTIRRQLAADVGRLHLRRRVGDSWTRRQLTPRTEPRRDRIVYSDRYHRTLRRRDVRLVTWPIAGFVAEGVRTADGLEHRLDVVARV